MNNQLTVILIFVFTLLYSYTKSQDFNEMYFRAEDYVRDGNYHKAIEIYKSLLKESDDNANVKFKLGFCYIHSATKKEKAVEYLEYASHYMSKDYNFDDAETKKAPVETLFYLGRAYHLNYQFVKL